MQENAAWLQDALYNSLIFCCPLLQDKGSELQAFFISYFKYLQENAAWLQDALH
jgi:hypothetical protein